MRRASVLKFDRNLFLSAGLKTERGCVADQPQRAASSSPRRKYAVCCGWSGRHSRAPDFQTGS
jgi:hypothetical protein